MMCTQWIRNLLKRSQLLGKSRAVWPPLSEDTGESTCHCPFFLVFYSSALFPYRPLSCFLLLGSVVHKIQARELLANRVSSLGYQIWRGMMMGTYAHPKICESTPIVGHYTPYIAIICMLSYYSGIFHDI